MSAKKPNYSVKWEWRHPDHFDDYSAKVDLTNATNAERAISKVRKRIMEEFENVMTGDIVIIHVVPIDGAYYDT